MQWFAIRVKSNREYITSQALTGKGYEVMLPTFRRAGRGGSSGVVPLFPGYLFSRFDVTKRLPVLTTPGIVHIVGVGKTPVPIDEDELRSLRIVLDAGLPVRRDELYTVGQKVHIRKGPLCGAGGIVTDVQEHRFVVTISLLQRSISVLLEPDWIGADTPVKVSAPSCAS
ncbi:MAG TPA: transcription termination/antitermination NusG family protein [Bryobacteraceae bacterium]|nr:transcription termination/antitermination NusG family protein [Bryobacteraceae bacterium]